MRRRFVSVAAAAIVLAASALTAAPGTAAPVGPSPRAGTAAKARTTQEASGRFTFTTGNGIVPTWDAANIRITGVSPGSAITNAEATQARVSIPVVAVNGSTVFAAGGFRLTNTDTGDFINCATPAIDTRALVIDCAVQGTNMKLFRLSSIGRPSRVNGTFTTTSIYRDVELRVASSQMAKLMNARLGVNVFSPYVVVGTGELAVTTDR